MRLLSQFVPDIQAHAAPAVNEVLSDVLKETENELRLGESYGTIVILKKNDHIYACTVIMSEDNKWVRTIECISMEDLVNMGIKKFLQKEE